MRGAKTDVVSSSKLINRRDEANLFLVFIWLK